MSSAYTSGEKRGLILLLVLVLATIITLALHKRFWLDSTQSSLPAETEITVIADSLVQHNSTQSGQAERKTKDRGKRRSAGKRQQHLPQRDPLDQPVN